MRKQMDNLMRDAVEGKIPDNANKSPFVFGFSVKTGPDGFPIFEDFGNTRIKPFKSEGKEPVVDTSREPLTDINETEAERQTLKFLEQYTFKSQSPLCGNTICQDRRFLARCMPVLEEFCHYRNIDVSSIRELGKRWYFEDVDNFQKRSNHRALDDIRESIEELRYYRKNLFKL